MDMLALNITTIMKFGKNRNKEEQNEKKTSYKNRKPGTVYDL
jgi:hypothetical protein